VSSLCYAGHGVHDGARQRRVRSHDQSCRRPRAADQFSRPGCNDPPAIHNCDPIAELVGFLKIVGTEENRPALVAHLANQGSQRAAGLRIETGGRLVEHQHSGPVDQRERQKQALPQTAGECGERNIGSLLQVKTREKFIAIE
jgi:hypothetical protein